MTQKPDIFMEAKELAASAMQNIESRHIPATPRNLLWKRRDKTADPVCWSVGSDTTGVRYWRAGRYGAHTREHAHS